MLFFANEHSEHELYQQAIDYSEVLHLGTQQSTTL
jgi:hypothetical protein